MKRLDLLYYIVLTLFLITSTLSAQTPKWVSTEIQNRTAVLEHFTGRAWSGYTQGQKKAIDLLKSNPDNFIVINIYCGLFAGYGYPFLYDLTTDEGNLIFDEPALQGYEFYIMNNHPSGSINRSTYPWAMHYSAWDTVAKNIINQKSPVNVYIKPEINFTTRELTVEVEYYYTDDSPSDENYLTVMLLQNEILDIQHEGQKYNPEYVVYNLNDTLYRHMYVFRKIISKGGTWGDKITNTKKGSYECRKYSIILPDSIKDVPLYLTNLEVAAFIAERDTNIYTGHRAIVEIPEKLRTNLAVEDITEYNNSLKFEPIHPKVKVTNKLNQPVTKFDIAFTLANTQTVLNLSTNKYFKIHDTLVIRKDNYSGTLEKGESAIFEFPEIIRADYKIASNYVTHASVSNIYNDETLLIEIDTTNNSTETFNLCLFDTAFSEIEITFDNTDTASSTPSLPAHTVLDNSINKSFYLAHSPTVFCGAKNSRDAVLFRLGRPYNVNFKPGYIMFGEVDCRTHPFKTLSYYYAYSDGDENGSRPRTIVEISEDWGKTWQRVSEIFCEETGKLPANEKNKIYIPTSDEYRLVQVNLSDLTNKLKENILVRIGVIPGTTGNALWIDEISLSNYDAESIEEKNNLILYPNPSTNILHINNNTFLGVEYEIYDMSGNSIIKDINNSNEINIENLSIGSYSLKIKDNIFKFIKK